MKLSKAIQGYWLESRLGFSPHTITGYIDAIYTAYPFYGSRRITVQLRREGTQRVPAINRKAVQRHMQEMGIAGICPGPNLSQRHLTHRVYPYLLRRLTVGYPTHVWGIDITYRSEIVVVVGSIGENCLHCYHRSMSLKLSTP